MKKFYLILVGLVFSLAIDSQTLQTYSGDFWKGKATYTYYENENEERIFHGKFSYTENPYRRVSNNTTLNMTGNFKHGMRDGLWTYTITHKKASYSRIQKIADASPSSTEVVKVHYKDGKLNGSIQCFEEGKLNKEKCFQMKDNHIIGSVYNSEYNIRGYFDKDGCPDGDFVMEYDGMIFTETFWKGHLLLEKNKNKTNGEIRREKHGMLFRNYTMGQKYYSMPEKEFIANYDSTTNTTIVDETKYELVFEDEGLISTLIEPYSYMRANSFPGFFISKVGGILSVCDIYDIDGKDRGFDNSGFGKFPLWVFKSVGKIENEIKEPVYEYDKVDTNPEFPGGEQAMRTFMLQNMKYPVVAEENGIQGIVGVSCVVETDGSLSDIKIYKGVDPALDKESLRVVKSMPKWKPGMNGGKPVRVKTIIPIIFRLS